MGPRAHGPMRPKPGPGPDPNSFIFSGAPGGPYSALPGNSPLGELVGTSIGAARVPARAKPLVNQAWTDLNYVGLRPPAGCCPGRLKAPRASTLIKSACGLLRSAFGLARPAEKTSVVSAAKTSVVSAAKKATTSAATSAATSDISMKSTTPWGGAEGCGG